MTPSAVTGDVATNDDVPTISVVKGDPTPEEIAALVVVLLSTPAADADPPPPVTSGWSDYRRAVRTPLHPGPQAWRLSGR